MSLRRLPLLSSQNTKCRYRNLFRIFSFRSSRKSLITEKVGSGFLRKLYSTYVSFLLPRALATRVPAYGDERGVLRKYETRGSGQFSFFTAKPGVTRGGHYHHTKTEKFLVVSGSARFRFRHVVLRII